MNYAVDTVGKSNELQRSLRGLEHDAQLILQEFNQHFLNRTHGNKVDIDVDRILGNLKCDLSCCKHKIV